MQKWSFRFRLRCKKKENKILNNKSQSVISGWLFNLDFRIDHQGISPVSGFVSSLKKRPVGPF